MATLGIGHFMLVVQDHTGKTISEVDAVSRSGRPVAGDRFRLLGAIFVVDRVEFEKDESPKQRNYYKPYVFLRPAGPRPLKASSLTSPPFALGPAGSQGATAPPLPGCGCAPCVRRGGADRADSACRIRHGRRRLRAIARARLRAMRCR
jgi:hypothetical protein